MDPAKQPKFAMAQTAKAEKGQPTNARVALLDRPEPEPEPEPEDDDDEDE